MPILPGNHAKRLLKELFRLLDNDIWYLLLPRCVILLFMGGLVLFRPAVSLHICAALSIFVWLGVMLFFRNKVSPPFCHCLWGIPAAAVLFFFLPRPEESAGVCFAAGVCLVTALRAWRKNTFSSKAAAGAAGSAAFILLVKSFTAAWFDIYPAAAPSFFASAVWESGNLKFIK